MARNYKKIDYQDRLLIEKMCKKGEKPSNIAKIIGVHRTTIYLELERGGAQNAQWRTYRAKTAQMATK